MIKVVTGRCYYQSHVLIHIQGMDGYNTSIPIPFAEPIISYVGKYVTVYFFTELNDTIAVFELLE